MRAGVVDGEERNGIEVVESGVTEMKKMKKKKQILHCQELAFPIQCDLIQYFKIVNNKKCTSNLAKIASLLTIFSFHVAVKIRNYIILLYFLVSFLSSIGVMRDVHLGDYVPLRFMIDLAEPFPAVGCRDFLWSTGCQPRL